MKRFAATIKHRVRSAGRWYVDSCSHLEPATALGMFGTGMVAIPVSLTPSPAEAC
jgi:hypothetical protein